MTKKEVVAQIVNNLGGNENIKNFFIVPHA